mgnify:CR=1 FL=1
MIRESVTRYRRVQSGADAYGTPIYTRTATALPPALFAPGGVSEPIEPGREPVVTEPTLYWPHNWPDVIASDELEVRGKRYAVIGEPADWRGSSVGGLVVKLKRAEEGAA